MHPPDASTRRRWLEVSFAIVSTLVFISIRAPLLVTEGAVRGWNSDAAIYGLMGQDVLAGRIPVFYWGQNYMGPFTSILTAGISSSLHPFVHEQILWALSLRLATIATFLGAIFIFGWVFRRRIGWTGVLAAALTVVGPPFFYKASVITNGPEMALLFSALIVGVALPLVENPRYVPGRLFLAGVVAGIGWWMNQGVVFAIAALVVTATLKFTGGWREWMRPRLPRGLFLAQMVALSWLAWNALALLLPASILPLRFRDSIAEPLAALAVIHLVAHSRRALAHSSQTARRSALGSAALLTTGFIAGQLPVYVGSLLGWYERTYSFSTSLNSPPETVAMLGRTMVQFLPRFIGFESLMLALPAILLVTTGAVAPLRHPAAATLRRVAFLVVAANLAHFIITQNAEPSLHYLVPSVPFFCLLLMIGARTLWSRRGAVVRVAACAATLLVACSWLVGAALLNTTIRSEADPRDVIAKIREQGYSVCLAGYWQAYHLQLFARGVTFIPWQSHDRTPERTSSASRIPGRRCYVTETYQVLPAVEP